MGELYMVILLAVVFMAFFVGTWIWMDKVNERLSDNTLVTLLIEEVRDLKADVRELQDRSLNDWKGA